MNVEKIHNYLEELINDYHVDFSYSQTANGTFPLQIMGEVFDDTDWNNIFDEPCLQIIFHATDMEDYDQWFLSDGGFALDERSMPEFSRRYGLTPRIERELYELYITMFLEESSLCPVEMFEELPAPIIDIMVSMGYTKKYSEEELSEIYNLIEHEAFLPQTAKDIFLF